MLNVLHNSKLVQKHCDLDDMSSRALIVGSSLRPLIFDEAGTASTAIISSLSINSARSQILITVAVQSGTSSARFLTGAITSSLDLSEAAISSEILSLCQPLHQFLDIIHQI
jgi:hypothetical protein